MPFNIGPDALVGILMISAVVAAALMVPRARRALTPSMPPDPRAVLAERLARGEISREDFDTAMRALGYAPPPAGVPR